METIPAIRQSVLWAGGATPPDALAGDGGLDVRRADSAGAIRRLAAGRAFAAPRVGFLLLDGNPAREESLLDAFHQVLPRTPIGLVVRDAQRAVALAWLRERRVDRLIPACHARSAMQEHLDALAAHGTRLESLCQQLRGSGPQTIFLTGATGFLGGHFLRYLLRCGSANAIALTRSHRGVPFSARLAHLQRLHPGRIHCVEGDVGRRGLGLSSGDQALVSERATAFWHLAAITKFEAILREAIFQVNLEGTRNALRFARRMPRLARFHHVSTAYAAGDWPHLHPVPEARLTTPHAFKNPYEESKFHAEQCVAESGLPAIVYRPSIIMGETVSGLCDGQTVYHVAKMLRLARLSGERQAGRAGGAANARTFRVVVDPGAAKNLIPVDGVALRMLHIAAGNPPPGSFFNLSHDTPTPMTDIIAVIASLLDIPEYEAVQTLDGARLSTAEAVLQRISGVFRPYMLKNDPLFEARRTAGCAPLPPMDRGHLGFLIRSFFEQHHDWEFQLVAVPV